MVISRANIKKVLLLVSGTEHMFAYAVTAGGQHTYW